MEIRVTDEAGGPLPPGVDGEVRLRGEAVCRGYLDPAQSTAAFDADGFLITGDVGHVRESGHLVLTGRIKDIIIRKGENISAKEIEDLLHTHPDVGDAAVIGLPDAERGRVGVRGRRTAAGRTGVDARRRHLATCARRGCRCTSCPSGLRWWRRCRGTRRCGRY